MSLCSQITLDAQLFGSSTMNFYRSSLLDHIYVPDVIYFYMFLILTKCVQTELKIHREHLLNIVNNAVISKVIWPETDLDVYDSWQSAQTLLLF